MRQGANILERTHRVDGGGKCRALLAAIDVQHPHRLARDAVEGVQNGEARAVCDDIGLRDRGYVERQGPVTPALDARIVGQGALRIGAGTAIAYRERAAFLVDVRSAIYGVKVPQFSSLTRKAIPRTTSTSPIRT